MRLKALLFAAGLVALTALLSAFTPVITDIWTTGRWAKGGLLVSTTGAAPSTHVMTNVLYGTTDVDFPAMGAASDYGGCLYSKGFAVAGAKVGDPCFAGYLAPTPFDGGNPGKDFFALCEVVATGIVVVKGCYIPGDAGSTDVADAGYTVRIISNQ